MRNATNEFRVKWVLGLAVVLAVFLAGTAPAAHAALARVGPVSNASSIGGFPSWYQDTTGLALEFCDPKNASEVEGGWCLLLPPDVPVTPEVFPANFFDEHFWFAAGAGMDTPGGGRALLVLAVEAAFATAVQPGDQVAFSRIRVVLNPVPVTGTYRLIHPYGEEIVDAVAGGRIFITDDIGITCPQGIFDCALQSRLGPFLLPSATPGGPEMPALTALNPTPDIDPAHFGGVFGPTPYPGTGKAYIADPARIGPVTGSPIGQNYFRIEGPAGSNLGGPGINFIQTSDFSLMGRVFQGAIPSQVTVDRANYARPLIGTQKVDVFATAFPAMQARLPAGAPPAVITPHLGFYDAACGVSPAGDLIAPPAGTLSHQMSSPGLMIPPQPAPASIYWGQSQPALIPPAVCVEHENSVNALNQIVPVFFQANVTDQVFITEAAYDPTNAGSLSVRASSSDEVAPPTLTAGELGDLLNGQFILAPLAAPPAKVRVFSSFGGSNEFQVTTGVGAAGGGNIPVAANDTATALEDSGTTAINVLTNDTLNGGPIPAGATLTIVAAPLLGTAAVSGSAINYTPNPNANGTDGFTYRVTVAGQSSNIAAVTVTITPVNDPPVAANDAATAIANLVTPIDVLANDTDPDGQANLAAPVNVTKSTSPLGSIWTLTVTGRVVNFTGNLPGAYTFTYQASDVAGAVSANTATVTVTVAAGETVTIQVAEFRTGTREWRVSGVIAPTTSGTVTIRYANGPNAGLLIGTAPITAGAWSFRESGVTGLRDPRTGQASQIRVTGPAGLPGAVATFLLRR